MVSVFLSIWSAARQSVCYHDWVACRSHGRLWLRCVRCEKHSVGVEIGVGRVHRPVTVSTVPTFGRVSHPRPAPTT